MKSPCHFILSHHRRSRSASGGSKDRHIPYLSLHFQSPWTILALTVSWQTTRHSEDSLYNLETEKRPLFSPLLRPHCGTSSLLRRLLTSHHSLLLCSPCVAFSTSFEHWWDLPEEGAITFFSCNLCIYCYAMFSDLDFSLSWKVVQAHSLICSFCS